MRRWRFRWKETRRTALDILQSLDTGRSPEMTFSRNPGLFLSFKLTKSERIFAL